MNALPSARSLLRLSPIGVLLAVIAFIVAT
jgi:hypothetical protein